MPNRAYILSVLLLVLLVVSTFVASTHSAHTSFAILKNWVNNALPLMLLSFAAGLIISSGQIDISSGAVFSLAGMFVVAWTLASTPAGGLAVVYGCLLAWGIVISLYVLMYLLVVFLRVPALLCTLGLAFCGQSLSLFLNASVLGVGRYRWHIRMAGVGSQTVPVNGPVRLLGWSLVWIPVVIVLLILWRYFSDAGLRHIALGMDPKAAEIAGVKTKRVYLAAFLMSGILVGLSALLYLVDVQRGGWAPNTGWGKELFAIAAAVLGGCRITGGRFDPICVALATLLVFAVRDTISALSLPVELEYIVLGIALIMVALIDFSERVHLRTVPSA